MISWEIDLTEVNYQNCESASKVWDPLIHPVCTRKKKQGKERQKNTHSELLFDLSSHLPEEQVPVPSTADMTVIFVPARILCFLADRSTGRTWAVVHPCESTPTTHSLLT